MSEQSPKPREWDAQSYERISKPMEDLARPVIERAALLGHETVIDAGCGSGRVTRLLIERLPAGRVIAVDGSRAMIEEVQKVLREEDQAVRGDLLDLQFDAIADLVYSTAAFHWVLDHRRLFARIAEWLKPGGRLVAQYGEESNLARLRSVADEVASSPRFSRYFSGWRRPLQFDSVATAQQLLAEAGFVDLEVWSETAGVFPADPGTYLRKVCLAPEMDLLPEALRSEFIEAVLAHYEPPVELDYVRLNVVARKPS